jgi:hypothetical protein
MFLKKAIELRKDIDVHRKIMCDIAMTKGINHPDVIKVSQLLDEKIILLQKMIYQINRHTA